MQNSKLMKPISISQRSRPSCSRSGFPESLINYNFARTLASMLASSFATIAVGALPAP